MKKLLHVLALVLAANFLVVAGGVGWLFASGKLDRAKVGAIRDLVVPSSVVPEVVSTGPATQPATQPATARLDELLARYAGRRAGEQVELVRQSVDAQAAALDRRARELDNLVGQILREKEELALKSAALDADRQRVADQENLQAAQAGDKGFQDSLKLYSAMPVKQTKAAFMTMPDDVAVRYLQAMPQRAATKIAKEFKTPEEQERINRLLDRMRQGGPATRPAGGLTAGAGSAANTPRSARPTPAAPGDSPPPQAAGVGSLSE